MTSSNQTIFQSSIKQYSHTFREPNKSKHIFRVHIKHYWHFEETYSQTMLHTFPDIKQY